MWSAKVIEVDYGPVQKLKLELMGFGLGPSCSSMSLYQIPNALPTSPLNFQLSSVLPIAEKQRPAARTVRATLVRNAIISSAVLSPSFNAIDT
jgi:hypothetical protein